jgi:hypothetical protein
MPWRCLLFGHQPKRFYGTYYVACARRGCTKTMNLRIAARRPRT